MSKSCTRKIGSWLYAVLVTLFSVSILVLLMGRFLCIRNTKNPAEKQDELFLFDEITTVISDEDGDRLYVCYNDASWVNVYDLQGTFLWAVSTPYLRNSYFEIQNGFLMIYGTAKDNAYLYDAQTGDFAGEIPLDQLDLGYQWINEAAPMEPGTICFDAYQVYRVASDGSLVTLVDRPGWYLLFQPSVDLSVAFVCAILIGIGVLIGKIGESLRVRKLYPDAKPSKKTERILTYFRVTSAVQIIYAVANIVCGFYGGFLIIGIFPVMLHFIISNIILYHKTDAVSVSELEKALIDRWKALEFATAVIDFLSVIVATGLAA
ncbi:MAG: hypothetical protein ACI3YK_07045 [Eubacteriales bacterium]